MTQRGDTAQKGGPPPSGKKATKRETPAPQKRARGKTRGATGTIEKGRRNEQILAGWLRGRTVASLAAEHGVRKRRIYEVIQDGEKAAIEELGLTEPWRGHQFADEALLRLKAVINDCVEKEDRARLSGNESVELGALKLRARTLKELTTFLQQIGRMPGLRSLKFEAEVGEFWAAAFKAFHDFGIPLEVTEAIEHALRFPRGSEERKETAPSVEPAPEQWRLNREEEQAAAQRATELKQREKTEAELRREAEARRKVEQRRAAEKLRELEQQRAIERRAKENLRSEVIQREMAEQEQRRAARQQEAKGGTQGEAEAEGPQHPDAEPEEQDEELREAEAERRRQAEAEQQRQAEAEQQQRILDPWEYSQRAAAAE
jgi:hypothetical protein